MQSTNRYSWFPEFWMNCDLMNCAQVTYFPVLCTFASFDMCTSTWQKFRKKQFPIQINLQIKLKVYVKMLRKNIRKPPKFLLALLCLLLKMENLLWRLILNLNVSKTDQGIIFDNIHPENIKDDQIGFNFSRR